jgi:anti-anti-sigma factor
VTFCSSAGLGVLADAQRRATAAGIDLLLIGVGRSVHRPLEVTGLASHFKYASDVDDALTPAPAGAPDGG